MQPATISNRLIAVNHLTLPALSRVSQKPNNSFPRSARVSQNFNSSFSRSEVVIPAKAGIQRQRWISAFSGMTRPGGHRAVWFWWRVSVDSRLRGNDENEADNDGSQRAPTPERVLRHPLSGEASDFTGYSQPIATGLTQKPPSAVTGCPSVIY